MQSIFIWHSFLFRIGIKEIKYTRILDTLDTFTEEEWEDRKQGHQQHCLDPRAAVGEHYDSQSAEYEQYHDY